ncbi:GET complex subunit get1 [Marasmius oreades]|uniref:GET complex subunit get1 n=1 Tax=Marasmius oreades TaxID=181124 RepID=A0A9P7V137_9AGAR|nr:GET complex subunit get1 [Marasmius oreades]KAG7098395.1 GET complex subunit get1 [Marasmius oreades]
MSIILTVFALVFLGELISWIGQSVLLEGAFALYLRLFYPTVASQQKKLKSDVLTTKAELLKTSAQDQFAKWAKLRRSVDKGLADLEKTNSDMASIRTGFSFKFNTGIWILTTGLQFFVGWWYRKAPIFYLPPGWFGPLGWVLALPFAPTGSVSVGMWQMTSRRVIKVGERVVKELVSPAPKEEVQEEKQSEKVTGGEKTE